MTARITVPTLVVRELPFSGDSTMALSQQGPSLTHPEGSEADEDLDQEQGGQGEPTKVLECLPKGGGRVRYLHMDTLQIVRRLSKCSIKLLDIREGKGVFYPGVLGGPRHQLEHQQDVSHLKWTIHLHLQLYLSIPE